MKPREYCCCAVPLVNAGIYATLAEHVVAAIVVGTLSIATPSIVGAATPSFAPLLLAIFCYAAAAVQVIGFLGVAQEKAIMYRRYVTLHTGATIAVFAVAAVWIIISASRHSTAQSNCETTFFPTPSTNGTTSSEGKTLCDIFSWVDIGLMAGIWVFFAVVQTYFLIVVSSYGTSQREDHVKYDALNDSTRPLTDDIPMADRADPSDPRASYEFGERGGYRHSRNESTESTVVGALVQKEGYGGYDGHPSASYPPQHPRLAQDSGAFTGGSQPNPFTDNQFSGQPRFGGY